MAHRASNSHCFALYRKTLLLPVLRICDRYGQPGGKGTECLENEKRKIRFSKGIWVQIWLHEVS